MLLEESEAQLSGRARFFPVLLPSANMSSAGVVTSEDTRLRSEVRSARRPLKLTPFPTVWCVGSMIWVLPGVPPPERQPIGVDSTFSNRLIFITLVMSAALFSPATAFVGSTSCKCALSPGILSTSLGRRAHQHVYRARTLNHPRHHPHMESSRQLTSIASAMSSDDTYTGTNDKQRYSLKLRIPTAEDMEDIGGLLSVGSKKGDIILLDGDLGAGKTCFSRGFIRGRTGMEDERVTSPTYLLSNSYSVDGGKTK